MQVETNEYGVEVYAGIEEFIAMNADNLKEWKQKNNNKPLYTIRHNLNKFGDVYVVVVQPTAMEYDTIRMAVLGDKESLDKAYNLLYSKLIVYPDKDKFAALYRQHAQYGLVHAIINQIGLQLGYTGDTVSKEV